MQRREFFKLLSAIVMASSSMSLFATMKSSSSENEIIVQVLKKDKSFAILFYDLKLKRHTLVSIPHQIHDILPIRNGKEFILTAKGGYLIHINRKKIIQLKRSAKDIMFFGHTSFDEKSELLYTSAIDYLGYDFTAQRRPKRVFKDDHTFGRGKVIVHKLDGLDYNDFFFTGGEFPHDQYINSAGDLVLLNSSHRRSFNEGGQVTTISLKDKNVLKEVTTDLSDGYCAAAHFFGNKEGANGILGISNEASVLFEDSGKLRKTKTKKKYSFGEMLNGSFSKDGTKVVTTNIDNHFVGLWDYKKGELLKSITFEKIPISVNTFNQFFVVLTSVGFEFFDINLNLQKNMAVEKIDSSLAAIYGPHSIIN